MKKILFEGTEDQIKNLMHLIEYGDNNLPTLREDYQLENLWSVNDVQSRFNCERAEALDVLKQALNDENTIEQIWCAIDIHGEKLNVNEKE